MASHKSLHIVAFDLPSPPNYGGIIDIYYKIKALHSLGIKITLHVFLYDGKAESKDIAKYCTKIYYYKRRRFSNPFVGEAPYIVATRDDEMLLKNLQKDSHPILFEGLHTTWFINNADLKNRFKIVRAHNVEHLYYKALEEAESGFFKKYFFRVESERLKKYEHVLKHASLIAAISPQETDYYKNLFKHTVYLPAFHSNETIDVNKGKGKFILYHGNLGVAENNKAALFLVHEVFSHLDIPCVIAGNNPSRQLQQAVKGKSNMNLVGKITSEDLLKMIQEAQINVMVTFQSTGIKLKLLNSLYRGRFCIVNHKMVDNTGLEEYCKVGEKPKELVQLIKKYWEMDYESTESEFRQTLLLDGFSNQKNALMLAGLIP